MVTVKFKRVRTQESCIFHVESVKLAIKDTPFCKLTMYASCTPEECPWYKSQEMIEESYEKARQNYLKNYGKDKYFQLGYAPLHKEDFAYEYH